MGKPSEVIWNFFGGHSTQLLIASQGSKGSSNVPFQHLFFLFQRPPFLSIPWLLLHRTDLDNKGVVIASSNISQLQFAAVLVGACQDRKQCGSLKLPEQLSISRSARSSAAVSLLAQLWCS